MSPTMKDLHSDVFWADLGNTLSFEISDHLI